MPEMKPRSPFGLAIVVATLGLGVGGLLEAQWRDTVSLRTKLELAHMQKTEWRRLQAENERLRAQQISATELEHLLADHAALPRLRAELEALQKKR